MALIPKVVFEKRFVYLKQRKVTSSKRNERFTNTRLHSKTRCLDTSQGFPFIGTREPLLHTVDIIDPYHKGIYFKTHSLIIPFVI